jgi:2',3'-cyclic-nucleotide 2'-phosphodiesterase/3'-nucleotidase
MAGAERMVKDSTATIVIVETSDLHGNILPIQYANNQLNEVGLAKAATLIRQARSLHDNVLVIDNGDLIQGTPLAYHHAKLDGKSANPMTKCLNLLGFDAAVIGNHEFNYGFELLQKAVDESQFPYLCANLVWEHSGEPIFGKPYMIKQFGAGGPIAAVLGLTTHYIPNWENPDHIAGIRFDDALETAKRWVLHLRDEEHADVIIVAYHGGFERDLDSGLPTEPLTGENQGYLLCTEVPGIDIMLTGHQHRLIAGKQINGVTVVQPGVAGGSLGKVTILLERSGERWRVAHSSSELLSVQGVVPDEEIVQAAQPHEQLAQVWLDQPIGQVKGDMVVTDPMRVRLKDSPLIEFINRVQMELSGALISNTALFDNSSPGFPANVTMRDIVSNYIYPNTLKVIRITGQDIKDALEQSASYFKTYTGGQVEVSDKFRTPKPQHYNYDMWEGITYRLNISRPVGERVVQLDYEGSPIDLSATFDVVLNNYRAGGGGNYTMFQGKPVVKDIPTDVAELLASYIMERGTIEAACNDNWEVVHD